MEEIQNIKPLYGFLDEKQLFNLNNYLINAHKKAIAFSRGDSDKLAIVDIIPYLKDVNTLQSTKDYLMKQVSEGYLSDKQSDYIFENMVGKTNKEKAAIVAVHEAKKIIWPKYAADIKGPANVFKRFNTKRVY